MTDQQGGDATFDPFFDLSADPEWNACIGDQAEPENYIDGYMRASKEIAEAILQKRLYEHRDTLIFPILFNARHAVELALKFVLDNLRQIGLIDGMRSRNHDIKAYLHQITDCSVGDEELRTIIGFITPFVISLAAIDDDGQMLRYIETTDGRRSLSDKNLANILVVYDSIKHLEKHLDALIYCARRLRNEDKTSIKTARCSRRDIFAIANMLPKRGLWNSAEFTNKKNEITDRYMLSGRQFSDALNVIQSNREVGTIIGIRYDLKFLSDDSVRLLVDSWLRIHRKEMEEAPLLRVKKFDLDKILAHSSILKEENEKIITSLSAEEIADADAVFDIGRNTAQSEYYDDLVSSNIRLTTERRREQVLRLTGKTNFMHAFLAGLEKLGRRDLASKLRETLVKQA